MATIKNLLPRNQVKNIIEVYKKATDTEIDFGMIWYELAKSYCNNMTITYQAPLWKIAGVVAALSPGVDWDRNKMDARDLIYRYLRKGTKPNPYRYGTYPANVRKAVKIWDAESEEHVAKILLGKSGWKTHAFFRNIIGDLSVVTVDRHAYKVANNIYEGGAVPMHSKRYRDTAQAYVDAAAAINETLSHSELIKQAELQAIVWVVYKRLNNHKRGVATNYVEPF